MAMDLVREAAVRKWTRAGHTWRDQTGTGMRNETYKPLHGLLVVASDGPKGLTWLTPQGTWDTDVAKARTFTSGLEADKVGKPPTSGVIHYTTLAAGLAAFKARRH